MRGEFDQGSLGVDFVVPSNLFGPVPSKSPLSTINRSSIFVSAGVLQERGGGSSSTKSKVLITQDDSLEDARKKIDAAFDDKFAEEKLKHPGRFQSTDKSTNDLGLHTTKEKLDESNDGRTIQGINADKD